MIVEGLGLAEAGNSLLPPEMEVVWRGSSRTVEILFGNIRDHSFDTLKGREGTWRILVDFPFGREADEGPKDDIAKVNQFINAGNVGRSMAWVPSFLTPNVQDQLGRLVVINFVLRGSNLEQAHTDRHRGEEGERPRQVAKPVDKAERGREAHLEQSTDDQQ